VAVTLQAADQGDTTTLDETLCEAGEQVAEQIRREAELRPQEKPKVHRRLRRCRHHSRLILSLFTGSSHLRNAS
jgi:hypothetical protein